jgi:hypothetical protein
MCRLTPQNVITKWTEEQLHVGHVTYVAGHVSLPSGVVTCDLMITCVQHSSFMTIQGRGKVTWWYIIHYRMVSECIV